ncbi:anti-CBASS protein Acb1 family protein, partial [Citrobacter sp. VF227]
FVETGRPIIQSMLGFVQLHLFGEVDPEITFAFEPLWSMSDKELAEVRKIEADTAAVYIDAGVLDKDEERKRLADDPESTYHGLDLNAVVEEPKGEGDLADVDEGDDDAGSAVMSLFDRAPEQRHDRSEPGRDAGTRPRGRASEAA